MRSCTRPNSWVSQTAGTTTQLTYALQIDPSPLTVSLPGEDPVRGSLELVVTNPTASTINVTSVAVAFQVGTASDNLTPTTAGISTAVSDTTRWTVQGPSSIITAGTATYTLSPQTGSTVALAAGASVVVQIYGFQTVQSPGNTTITVKEMIGSTPGFTSFQVTTFPSGFYFNGLAATVQNGSQLIPVAQVKAGSPVTLVWNCSVVELSSFQILYSSADRGQQSATPSDTGEWTTPTPLTSDTVFTVVVTMSAQGGQPLSASLSTVVSVQNPTVIAAQATIDALTVTGPAGVAGLTVDGALNATGSSTLSGTTTVGSQSTPADLTVNGDFSVTGAAAISPTGTTTVGALQVNSDFNAPCNATVGPLVAHAGTLSNFMDTSSATNAVLVLTNSVANSGGNEASGLQINVASNGDPAIRTNGLIQSNSGVAMMTHVQTRLGPRVATSPLVLEAEVHLSGNAKLQHGKAYVPFGEHRDFIAGSAPYRTLLTPTGPCAGLFVASKSSDGFHVEELGHGKNDATFDWLVIAQKRSSLDNDEAYALPAPTS